MKALNAKFDERALLNLLRQDKAIAKELSQETWLAVLQG
jgi:hypothetical protein